MRAAKSNLLKTAYAACLLLCLALVSCGKGSSTATVSAPIADFSLTSTPATVALTAGGAGKRISINAVPTNGFSGSVAVSIGGLPAGVTANPTTLTLTPGTAQNVTLTAASTTAAGNATLTLTGTSGTPGSSGVLSHSATVAATISATAPVADFSLTSTPATIALTAGSAGKQISVNAVPMNGFTGKVAVSIGGLPAGVTASPATLTLTPGTTQSVTLSAASTAATGNATLTLTGTSGTLTHSVTVTTTISATAPAADFSLTLSPASLTLSAGATGTQTRVLATAVNSFSSTVAVSISGLPAGVTASPASLSLTPGTAQSVTLTAASSAAAATSTITFTGVSGSLTHSASLALTVQAAVTMTNAPDVTTYHNDIARDGLNAKETILTLSNVNSTQFGKLAFDTVDGLVDAQPLYLANVTAGGKARNVLYVATENDSVYAFDADTGAQIWMTSILGKGEVASDNHGCAQITPQIGITSTPVIDRKQGANGTLFTIGMTKDASGNYHQRLHALDITTGKEIVGSPTEIAATYPGTGDNTTNGNVVFDPSQYAERAALLLLNGNIYTAWTSHCDANLYTGWVIAYSQSTLARTAVFNAAPNSGGTGPSI